MIKVRKTIGFDRKPTHSVKILRPKSELIGPSCPWFLFSAVEAVFHPRNSTTLQCKGRKKNATPLMFQRLCSQIQKMKISLFFIWLIATTSFAQQFECTLIFEDALGNTDTLIYGYDTSATHEIDALFGEFDLITVPINSAFEVRFSDVFVNGTTSPTHQSKKQIIPNDCPDWLQSNFGTSIEIYSDNYPISIRWNSALFGDSCRMGSILTDVHPGGWFDSQGTFRTFLEQTSDVTIAPTHYHYINGQAQNIDVLWAAFMDTSVFEIPFNPIIFDPGWTAIEELHAAFLSVYPNPVESELTVDCSGEIRSAVLLDLKGKVVWQAANPSQKIFDVSFLESGFYLLKIETDDHNTLTRNIVKH